MKQYGGKGKGWQLGALQKAEKMCVGILRREKELKKKKDKEKIRNK